MSYYVKVNGEEIEMPDEVDDFVTFARECSSEQVVAMIGRAAALAYANGCDDKDVQIVVNDVALQIAAWRDPKMIN